MTRPTESDVDRSRMSIGVRGDNHSGSRGHVERRPGGRPGVSSAVPQVHTVAPAHRAEGDGPALVPVVVGVLQAVHLLEGRAGQDLRAAARECSVASKLQR